jgi:hypothetical protein
MGSNIVRFDAARSVAIASITGSYTKLGTAFTHAMRVLHFTNDSNGTYMLSFDGTTDNFPVLADGFVLYDLTSDQDDNESFRYEKGSQLWIKSIIAPTSTGGVQSDTFYAAAVYGKGE